MGRFMVWVAVGSVLVPLASTPIAEAKPIAVVSSGVLGDVGDFAWGDPTLRCYLNTDTGDIATWKPNWNWTVIRAGVGRVVSQGEGLPSLMVFDFSTFTVPEGRELWTVGSRPCVIATTGDVQVLGNVIAQAGGYAGGLGQDAFFPTSDYGNTGSGPGGGYGGQGRGTIVRNPDNTNDMGASGGGGGGAGGFGGGQAGHDGNPGWWDGAAWQMHGAAGGSASGSWNVVEGGSGGGGGGGYISAHGYANGDSGGQGGGALLLCSPGDMTVGPTGLIAADGAAGSWRSGLEGGGGGGAGGYLAFEVAGDFLNLGTIVARGGAGTGNGVGYSAGGNSAGGWIYIDPASITNSGTIDVGGGDGGADPALFGAVGIDPGTVISGAGSITGTTVIVPEPATMALLALGGLGLLLSRRRA